jgi:hypothetical protein
MGDTSIRGDLSRCGMLGMFAPFVIVTGAPFSQPDLLSSVFVQSPQLAPFQAYAEAGWIWEFQGIQ